MGSTAAFSRRFFEIDDFDYVYDKVVDVLLEVESKEWKNNYWMEEEEKEESEKQKSRFITNGVGRPKFESFPYGSSYNRMLQHQDSSMSYIASRMFEQPSTSSSSSSSSSSTPIVSTALPLNVSMESSCGTTTTGTVATISKRMQSAIDTRRTKKSVPIKKGRATGRSLTQTRNDDGTRKSFRHSGLILPRNGTSAYFFIRNSLEKKSNPSWALLSSSP